ncbi:Stomatin-3 [Aphelenchoides fujianensis]|nr:Stomatin-3 [Aphelenchoides fujianensis]
MLPGQRYNSPPDGFHTNPLLHFAHEPPPRSVAYYIFLALAWFLFACTLPFSLFLCIKVVHEYKRMVVFRLGRLKSIQPMGPGVVIILPCVDEHHMIDLRAMSYEVPSQEMLTKDSVTVSVDAAVIYKVSDPIATCIGISDAHLSHQEVLDEGTDPWGIKVERVEVKDIRLPEELTRVLAAEAEASREADAKVVHAAGELNASHALNAAANQFGGSSTAMQLRYLQTLSRISTHKNRTIVLPIPMEMVKKWLHQQRSKA